MSADSPLELHDRLEIPRLALSMRLRLGRGGLYIFAVESEAVRQAVQKALQEQVNTEVAWLDVRITPDRHDVLPYLRHLVQTGAAVPERTIFSLTGLPETVAAQLQEFPDKRPPAVLNALNLRREYIPDHNLSLVLWVDEATRQRLPYDAKDFWVFRQETCFFRDIVARRREHLAPPPPVAVDKEIARLRDQLERYRRQRPDDYGAIGRIAADLGQKLYNRSRPAEALTVLQDALDCLRREKDQRGVADVLSFLGSISQTRGELETALSYFQEALRLARESGDVERQAVVLRGIGEICRIRKELQRALSYCREAQRLFQAIGAKLEVSKTEETINKIQEELEAA